MSYHPATSLMKTISTLGLSTGLKMCLDSADSNSWPGTGQLWLDTSGATGTGSPFDMILGGTVAVNSVDPVFVGNVGGLSANEYWTFDGTQNFFSNSGTTCVWISPLHSAGATFTILMAIYPVSSSVNQSIAATSAGATVSRGIDLRITPGGYLEFYVGSSILTLLVRSDIKVRYNTWNIVALSFTESTPNSFFYISGQVTPRINSVYVSPDSGAPASAFRIGRNSSAGADMVGNGTRIGYYAVWQGVMLTAAQITSIDLASSSSSVETPTIPFDCGPTIRSVNRMIGY